MILCITALNLYPLYIAGFCKEPLRCLSPMRGNSQAGFLRGLTAAMPSGYPTRRRCLSDLSGAESEAGEEVGFKEDYPRFD